MLQIHDTALETSTSLIYLLSRKCDLADCILLGASMENASRWTLSRTAASVWRVTAVPCVTNRGSCSTPAVVCPANTAAARSQTQEMPTVTVKVAILGNFVTQVGLLCQSVILRNSFF